MSTRNASKHSRHQAAYLERRKAGLQRVPSPWHWLTLADVQRLAVESFRIASYQCRDVQDAASTPEMFTEALQQAFEVLVADAATASGFHVASSLSQDYAQAMRADLPAGWSPQYPVYVAPQQGEVA